MIGGAFVDPSIVGTSPFERSKSFLLGRSLFNVSGKERSCVGMRPGLSECDAVDRSVDLSVPGAAEAVPVGVAGPHRRRRSPVVTCECVSRSKQFDAGDFADQLGRGERPDAVDPSEVRSRRFGPSLEFLAQLVDVDGELADPLDEISGDPSNHGVERCEAAGGDAETLERGERTRIWVPGRIDLVQVPAKPVDVPCLLRYQVFSMIDQQPKLSGFVVEMRGWQVRFTPRLASNPPRCRATDVS